MSRVYGSRVSEPRIIKRSVLPSDKKSSSWADLAQAWASLGEAKNMLHKLDQLSPPSKDKDTTLKNHRRLKPSTVHFSPEVQRTDLSQGHGVQRAPVRTVGNSFGDSDKENVVEGTVLNDTHAREEEGGSRHRGVSYGRTDTSTTRSRAPISTSVPVFTTATVSHTSPTASNLVMTHHTHSNARAVFGPPVSFGDYPRASPDRPTTTRGKEDGAYPRISERPLTRKTHPSHPYLRPPTGPGGSSASGTTNQQAPLRKFELPADTLNSLRTRIEQQKQAVRATAAKVASVAPGFHPLPEASKSLDGPPDPYRQRDSTVVGSRDFVGRQTKKRKVASVPPPPSYCGFSSPSYSLGESVQWMPNLERVSRPATQPPSSAWTKVAATDYNKPSRGRIRKVHRIEPSPDVGVTPHPPASREAITRPGIITTSSWRAGKKLTDRILKQGEQRERNLSATSSLSHDHSDVSSVSSMALEDEVLPPRTEYGGSTNTAKLLDELMSPREEDSNQPALTRPKRYATGHSSSAAKKPRYNYEPVYPTERVRHYDQAEVQRYMQRKQEEKKKLEREQCLAAEREKRERQDRLEELFQKQKKTLSAHVKHKQRQREAYSNALASAPVHIHLQEATTSDSEVPTDDAEPPLLIITPPRPHPPNTSPRPHPPNTSPRPHPPNTSPRIHVSPRREGTKSASPSISLPMSSPSTSPRGYTSPRHSPLVHRTADRSPPRYSTLETAASPYLPGSYSPTARLHSHSPLSPHTYSICRASPSPTSSPGHNKEFVSPPSSTACTLMSPREVKVHPPPPPSGELTSLLRGGGRHKSREERIKELTVSALKLKERIAMETKKLTVGAHDDPRPQKHSSPSHNTPCSKTPVILPGVQSIHAHALEAEKAREEAEAALRIQAAYRGYQVRKSLQWELPSGRTLGSAVRTGDGAEVEKEQLPPTAVSPATIRPGPQLVTDGTSPEDQSVGISQSCPVFGVSVPSSEAPWQRTGGDSHSVINVFTRQHEQLRESLAQLRSQKLAELRQIQAAHGTATSADVSTVRPTSGGSRVDTTYSQTFEEPSQNEDDGMSQLSDQFSQDSLVGTTPTHTVSQSHEQTASDSRYLSSTQPATTVHSETTREVSAITPPGSPSFVESFSDQQPPLEAPAFKPELLTTGRLSPRSLELKLQAELNLLESVEESMRHLSAVENTRAVSLAQRETVTLAQLLKSHQQTHEREVKSLAVKAKKEVEEAHKQFHQEAVLASEQVRKMREDAEAQAREQRTQLAQLQEESTQASREATQQLVEARTQATAAVIGAARQQMQAAQDMAVSVATAATQQAIKSALKTKMGADVSESTDSPSHPHTEPVTYPSDFEASKADSDSIDESITPVDNTIDESITPVGSEVQPLEEGEGDRTLVEDEISRTPTPEDDIEEDISRTPTPEDDIEEDIDEVSFRELLPSESHRRQRSRRMHSCSDSESRVSSPLPQEDRGEHSPVTVEDSFFQFTQRMVQQYMREEELRSKHQSTLLKLRGHALQEKTQAELEWLQLKKKQLRNKGADDLMVKREKDLFRKLQHEQAEIHHLKEAQKAASQERRLMLLQQAEISKIRRSAQYYREKIHRYSSQQKRDVSPSSDRDLFSPSPSLDDTREVLEESLVHSTPDHSISEDLPEEPKTPEELPPTRTSITEQISEEVPSTVRKSPMKTRNLQLNSPSSDSVTVKKLKEMASSDSKRGLTQRERRLQKRRHIAETALRQQQALLEREQQLDREEENVNRLVDQAMQYYEHRSALRKDKHPPRTEHVVSPLTTHHDKSATINSTEPSPASPSLQQTPTVSEQIQTSTDEVPSLRQTPTVSEQIQTSTDEVPEEITRDSLSLKIPTVPTTSKIPSEYASDTFESLEGTLHPSPSHIITSTPAQPQTAKDDDTSLSDSLKITSVSDSVASMTSEGSAIEVRIKVLREQLRARKEEVRQMQNEQKRKKKVLLRQQEEQLRRKLEAVESVIDKAKKSTPLLVAVSSATSSQTEEDQATPQPTVREPLTPGQVVGAMTSREEAASFSLDDIPLHLSTRVYNHIPEEIAGTGDETVHTATEPVTEDLKDVTQPVTEDLSSPEVPVEVSEEEEGSTISSVTEHLSQEEEEETASEPAFSYSETFERPSEEVPTAGAQAPEDVELTVPGVEAPEDVELTTAGAEAPEDVELTTAEVEAPEDVELTTAGAEAPEDVELTTAEVEAPEDVEVPTAGVEAPEDVELTTAGVEAPEDVELTTAGAEAPEDVELTTAGVEAPEDVVELTVPEVEAPEGEATHEPSYTETFEDTYLVHTSISELRKPDPHEDDLLGEGGEDGQVEPVFYPGQRVLIGNVMAGTVRFLGHTHFAEGLWVGVELDMPKGRNDGSIGGHEYFHCEPRHGLFAPPSKVSLFADGGVEENGAEGDSVDEEIESSLSSTQEEEPKSEEPDKEPQSPPPPSYTADFESEHEQIPSQAILPGDQFGADADRSFQEEPDAELITEEASSALLDGPSDLPPHLLSSTITPLPEHPLEFSEEVASEEEHPKAGSIANGFVQELSNEAFETMHQIWRSKVVMKKDKDVPLTLEEKAERISDELLKLLLQSEANLVCNIHSAKKSRSPPSAEIEEPASPTTGRVPPSHLTITVPTLTFEASPPILSPPSPYRGSPPPMEFSPPGSPPRHLSQASQARVTAGDKTPFISTQQDPSSPTSRKASLVLERSSSVESISQLLDSITLTTSQCMVPSERKHIDTIVEHAWNTVRNIDIDGLHSTAFECPEDILSLFTDIRELNREEDLCRKAYLRLIYNLAIEIVKILKPIEKPRPVWAAQCSVGAQLSRKSTKEDITLEVVQKKVYAAVMRGQLPLQLPAVRFLHGRKRPGGREIDFVDTILIRELRDEEPSWVDYSQDETQVKLRTADAILDQLLSETVQILCTIEQKRKAP